MDFDAASLRSVVDGSIAHIPSHNGGIVGLLQKLPYLRLFYTQYFKGGGQTFGDIEQVKATPLEDDYEPALEKVLAMLAAECEAQGLQPIIVYNSSVLIKEDGSAYTDTNAAKHNAFARLCEEKGICFIDLCPRFIQLYETEHLLPYGFSNTSPGGGHINKVGHRIFAEEVCKAIQEMEG